MDPDPFKQFALWFEEARSRPEILLPEAMCLSTVDPSGQPEGRMLLLKGYGESGFVFFTNLESPKARSLERNPRAALTFHWEALRRQVRISGTVAPLSGAEVASYCATRPRPSQIAAWVSRQSRSLDSREVLERDYAAMERRFEGREVPPPPAWGGYRLAPDKIEFWQERPNRLHDRFLYTLREGAWDRTLLYP